MARTDRLSDAVARSRCCVPASLRPPLPADPPDGVCRGPGAIDDTAEMAALAGGVFRMGTSSPLSFRADGEGPVRSIELDAFLIDRFATTNDEFVRFVAATGHATDAERAGSSFVFEGDLVRHDTHAPGAPSVPGAPWWRDVAGASWRHPEGPGSDVAARGGHPVVHISWNDARAYAAWARKCLPTEAEWEFAARGGLDQKLYPWGDELMPGGQHLCNIWQGRFPNINAAEDGYAGTCPVDAFPPNGFGLFGMTGNCWEWCDDWFDRDHHTACAARNPKGPPDGQAKVIKGGSYLCHYSYCNRYRVAARSGNMPSSSTSNMGFRCAKDASQ